MFAHPVPLEPLLLLAIAAMPAMVAVREARAEREAQRQMDMFELGMRVATLKATR